MKNKTKKRKRHLTPVIKLTATHLDILSIMCDGCILFILIVWLIIDVLK